ncbi:hypothetical protein L228DRAFT_251263 [Xylona heveae TC161]|uniref:Secreted protein n=1 Tax=Xylona heveae (strain CBS 132557 / TC161) TaxID=1328760 RepID=A0A164ZJ89_XYLHT|nr:hypothetical protein L228DRAFT_251263 [Xylona heveae TC161]KZF19166.1 hypothetical protein L228DRAFT_251263 [Xylona heveae TC161]
MSCSVQVMVLESIVFWTLPACSTCIKGRSRGGCALVTPELQSNFPANSCYQLVFVNDPDQQMDRLALILVPRCTTLIKHEFYVCAFVVNHFPYGAEQPPQPIRKVGIFSYTKIPCKILAHHACLVPQQRKKYGHPEGGEIGRRKIVFTTVQ